MDIDNDTPIGFGKLRGKPHKELLKSVNENYREWIVKQGSEFKYCDTRQYILENCDNGEEIEMTDMLHKLVLYVSKNGFVKSKGVSEDLISLADMIKEKVKSDVDTCEA